MPEGRPSFWRWWPVGLPGTVLAIGIGIQGVPVFRETPHPRAMHLAQAVPASVPGWNSHDLPLGANEFLSGEAEKILNYDDVVYREFDHAETTFGVYVAYWGAGKMPTRMIAIHTPDRCWTGNGWNCLAMKFRQTEHFEGQALQPAEWREFEPPDGGARRRTSSTGTWSTAGCTIMEAGSTRCPIPGCGGRTSSTSSSAEARSSSSSG